MYGKDVSDLLKENRKLKKENDLCYQFNLALILLMLLILAFSFSYCCKIQNEQNRIKSKLQMYQLMYDEVVNTKEYKAVVACKQEDFWKLECLDFELNERK